MISEKMIALGEQRSKIREIAEYGWQRKALLGAENVFDFSLGNPSIPAPPSVTASIARLLQEKDACALHGYTSSAGDAKVRQTIADSIHRRFSFPAKAEYIYMTCGAAASLTIAFHALLNPSDEVVVLAPFFPEYRVFVEKAGGVLVEAPCVAPSFQPDLEALARCVTAKTKAVLINSPNNPTGAVYSEECLRSLAEILKEKEKEFGTEIYLVADEPYRELYYGKEGVPYLPCLYDRCLVAYSYSKSLSLPGERIGYLMVSPDMPRADKVFAAVCGAGRSLGFVCAPSLWQYVIGENCEKTSEILLYQKNRDRLYQALVAMGYEVTPPDGAFYLFVKSPDVSAEAFCEKAKKYEILLVPSDSFGVKGYVRIAYCTSPETIERALPAFEQLMREYR